MQQKYIRGIGLLAAKNSQGQTTGYLFNAHGDMVQLTDSSGNVTRNYDYDAFGVEKPVAGNPTGVDGNPFRYCGEYFDAETGSVYLRARYYDPRTGRFGAEDPIRDGLNWYTYASGNPIRFVDPLGLWSEEDQREYEVAQAYLAGEGLTLTDIWESPLCAVPRRLAYGFRDMYYMHLLQQHLQPDLLTGEYKPLTPEQNQMYWDMSSVAGALMGGYATNAIINSTVMSGSRALEVAKEALIIDEAKSILRSAEFANLRTAQQLGQSSSIKINGRIIQYEPTDYFSGMTVFENKGFILGNQAFGSEAELSKTLLHELYRLNFHDYGASFSAGLATAETRAAFDFAERSYWG